MTALLACPACDSIIIFPGRYSGSPGLCPNCGHTVAVPAKDPSPDTVAQLRGKIQEEAKRITRYKSSADTRVDAKA